MAALYLSPPTFNIRHLFLSSLIVLAVVLNGCTGLQTAQDYLLNEAEGLVFFTMTESGQLSEKLELTFINESNNKKVRVALHQGEKLEIGSGKTAVNNVLSYDEPRGKLVVLRLPEAIYRLDQWQSGQLKLGRYSLASSPNKKFKVKSNHALYLGNIHLLASAEKKSLLIRDNRQHDHELFFKHYPRVDKNKLLIASKLFLDPATGRERFFDVFTGCGMKDYELISKKRLPSSIEKFRTLQVASKERKISRIDGYRLKFRTPDGPVALSMKIELSDVSQYVADKKVINDWMNDVGKVAKGFRVTFEDKGYFSEYQIVTNVLDEKRMIYMVVMFDDVSQLISNVTFINPPEYLRTYQSVDAFIPRARQLVSDYQQCVIDNLNKVM